MLFSESKMWLVALRWRRVWSTVMRGGLKHGLMLLRLNQAFERVRFRPNP